MPLQLHNTLSRQKETFEPIDADSVRMYVCGPTVYGDIHVGNARPLVVFDVLYRLLRRRYGENHVSYVRNITDVDDKINARALELGEDISELTARTATRFHEDVVALGCLRPDVEPRATDHIVEMQAMIQRLLDSGHAYVADGHVLFHVSSMPDYGRLSRRNRDELIAGARVEVAPYKRDPADFVLWKPSSPDLPGWDSRWGRGRPGWHLECSAMSEKHLGREFDIHGGGLDLVFPHHENEIAQSLCANPGTHFARYWVHNGYVQSEGKKMSKSLGNFYTVCGQLETYPGEAIRLLLLQAHYRQPLDFTVAGLHQAKETLDRYYGALRGRTLEELDFSNTAQPDDPVEEALLNDLNTPEALRHLHDALSRVNKGEGEKLSLQRALRRSGALLGLLQHAPEAWFKTEGVGNIVLPGLTASGQATVGRAPEQIDAMVEARLRARGEKNYAESDRIREELRAEGIILEDRPDGTTEWRRV